MCKIESCKFSRVFWANSERLSGVCKVRYSGTLHEAMNHYVVNIIMDIYMVQTDDSGHQ